MAQRPELFAIRPDQIAGDGCVLALDVSTISGLYALKLDGIDDYALVPHHDSLNLSNSPEGFTLEIVTQWKYGPWGELIRKDNNYCFSTEKNKVYFNYQGPTAWEPAYSCNADLVDGQWYHLVVTLHPDLSSEIYVNGKRDATHTFGQAPAQSTQAVGLGCEVYDSIRQRFYGGKIYLVRIYNRALNANEIRHNLVHHLTPVIDGLVLWIPFDEGSGTTAADRSGKGNDGTIYGAVWEKQALEDLSGYRNDGIHYGPVETRGRYLRALSFDGVDDYVNCGNNASLDVKRITIMAWAYETKSGRENCIASKEGVYRLAINHGKPHFRIATANITWSEGYLDGNTTIPNNEWHHLAMTYDGSKGILYLDGVEDGSRAITGDLLVNTQDLWIGGTAGAPAAGSSQYFDGNIDVCIYNRVLSPDEIKARYLGARLLPQRTLTKLR